MSGAPECINCGDWIHSGLVICDECSTVFLRQLAERDAEVARLIANDAYAATFQTIGQYRSALLAALAPSADGAGDVA